MIVLDTHIWVNWILLGVPDLTTPIVAAMDAQSAMAVSVIHHDALLACVDSLFSEYLDLAGRLIAR